MTGGITAITTSTTEYQGYENKEDDEADNDVKSTPVVFIFVFVRRVFSLRQVDQHGCSFVNALVVRVLLESGDDFVTDDARGDHVGHDAFQPVSDGNGNLTFFPSRFWFYQDDNSVIYTFLSVSSFLSQTGRVVVDVIPV